MQDLVLLSDAEQKLRLSKVREAMAALGLDSAVISSNANIYYLTGRVFSGYVYLPSDSDEPVYFVKRPVHLRSAQSISIRKPEGILGELQVRGRALPSAATGLELGRLTWAQTMRLAAALGLDPAALKGVDAALDSARAVKTQYEQSLMAVSGAKQERVYRKITQLYEPGMTDVELQIEIERTSRLEGCLGQFRVAGDDMEIYMGNVLAGDNADSPSPYDFAMGGAGQDPSLPVGANGSMIRTGQSVMVDMNGNFTGYMTDMTRTFALGTLPPQAEEAHKLSIAICKQLAAMGVPGTEAKALYQKAEEMAAEAGLSDFFMGHRQKAGFVGHGVGIEINEQPVIAPRSKAILQVGNAIALEPKFVIPGVGAVGVENTYIVTAAGPMQCITRAPMEIMQLDK